MPLGAPTRLQLPLRGAAAAQVCHNHVAHLKKSTGGGSGRGGEQHWCAWSPANSLGAQTQAGRGGQAARQASQGHAAYGTGKLRGMGAAQLIVRHRLWLGPAIPRRTRWGLVRLPVSRKAAFQKRVYSDLSVSGLPSFLHVAHGRTFRRSLHRLCVTAAVANQGRAAARAWLAPAPAWHGRGR